MKLQKSGENENQLKTKNDEGILLLFCLYHFILLLDTFANHGSINMDHEMILEKFKVLTMYWPYVLGLPSRLPVRYPSFK